MIPLQWLLLLSLLLVVQADITTSDRHVPLVRWSFSSSSSSDKNNNYFNINKFCSGRRRRSGLEREENETMTIQLAKSSHHNNSHQRQLLTNNINLDVSNVRKKKDIATTINAGRQRRRRNISSSPLFAGASPSLLYSSLTTVEEASTTTTTMTPVVEESTGLIDKTELLRGITQPLIPEHVWDELSGDEFETHYPSILDALAQSCYKLVSDKTHRKDDPWIRWTPSYPKDSNQLTMELEDGDIKVFIGKCNDNSDDVKYIGSSIPLIKTISHLPMSPTEIMDLMMDSSRIQIYNKLSLGRKDIKILSSNNNNSDDSSSSVTKIVRNVVKLPVTNKKVMSTTLLHSRSLGDDDGPYLMISRAVHGDKYDGVNSLSPEERKMGVSYILLGVNLFEPIGSGDECRMTAITHAYQPGVPTMIAQKAGVKSAIGFVKDIRALVIPA